MRAEILLLLATVMIARAIPIQVIPDEEGVKVILVDSRPTESHSSESTDSSGKTSHDREQELTLVTVPYGGSEEKDVQEVSESSMGKRSIALGRSGFRPGKRSTGLEYLSPSEIIYNMKRSMAIGRIGLRPGKRSVSFGRVNFRPGKRSMAYGRQGFRPGKRSAEVPDFPYQSPEPDFYII